MKYYFKVSARNSKGYGPSSLVATYTTRAGAGQHPMADDGRQARH